MAKCVGPAHSTETRGAVGPLVYNTYRGLRVVKMHTSPSQPRSSRQLYVRSLITRFSRTWATLTALQRAAWTTWANDHPRVDWTNSSIRMTGADAYAGLNCHLVDAGQTVISDPPAVNGPEPVAGLALTPTAHQISIAFTAHTGTGTQIDIWLYGPHSAGRMPTINKAKHSSYSAGETTPVVKANLAAGTWTVFARFLDEATGQVSSWVYADCVVPAA